MAVPQPFLVADGFRLCRLDGTMTNKQRQAELKRFSGKGVKAGEGAEVGEEKRKEERRASRFSLLYIHPRDAVRVREVVRYVACFFLLLLLLLPGVRCKRDTSR